MDPSNTERWSSEDFHREVTSWVADACALNGIGLTGEPAQPHNRAWSSAISFESTAGRLWFKVNGAGTSHEPALVAALARLVPDLVPELVDVDLSRFWSLTRDAGPVLRSVAGPDELWSHWEGIVARYAEGQLVVAAHLDELRATRLPQLGPAALPDAAARLVKDLAGLPPESGGLLPAEATRLEQRLPAYQEWCAELVASGIPDSIQHDDLHSNNVCWRGSVDQARVIDWGDASLGHPLATMLATLNSISYFAGRELDDPRVVRVRDAYLEPFSRFAAHHDLVRLVGAARRTGCVTRALAWQTALLGVSTDVHAGFDFPVRGWLLELLET